MIRDFPSGIPKPEVALHFKARLAAKRGRCGAALVLVLAFLVLITGLVLAFFSSVSTELGSAKSYASGVSTKLLADSAVSTVMAQIRKATDSASANGYAWASQPGMIRTYDATTSSGSEARAYYKLYSSDNMEITYQQIKGGYRLSDDLKMKSSDSVKDWALKPAVFTDLNAPVTSGTTVNYPVMHPTLTAEGFSLGGNDNPAAATSGANPAPMPVKWVYVLKDGTLTAPTGVDTTGKVASWSGAPAYKVPSATNPIVGRIAFWTDDECCKVNLNTASEPTPWDTPRAVVIQDLNYGKFQPAQKEFQRFPGHPFSVALSPVFFPNTPSLSTAQKQSIYDLIPRVQWGGSNGATTSVSGAATVTPDTDRLFASVDEFVFKTDANTKRVQNPLVTPAMIQQSRFLLTSSSRAPELNLFGQPRISLWPINTNAALRTVYDNLAAFCGTIGSGAGAREYYFQRTDATSPTADWTGIARNQKLYSYLQNLTGKMVPGFGVRSFKDKWGADRDQILTEIFDYIRSLNLRDSLLVQQGKTRYADNGQVAPIQIGPPVAGTDTKGFGRFHSISQFGMHFICAQNGPDGAITSQYPALTANQSAVEAALLFEPFSPSLGYYELLENVTFQITFRSAMSLDGTDLQFPTGTTTISSSGGALGNIWHGRHWGGAQGIRGVIVRGGGANYALVGKMRAKVGGSGKTTMSFSGGTIEVKVFSGAATTTPVQTFTVTFPSGTFPIPTLVKSGTVAYRGTSASTPDFWWTFKGYTDVNGAAHDGRYKFANECPHAPGAEFNDPTRRWGTDNGGNQPGFKRGSVFRAEDVVRTMVPDHGDIRLIAAMKDVPAGAFVKNTYYDDSSVKLDHIFSEPQGPHMLYGFSNEPGPAPAAGLAGNPLDSQLVPSSNVKYHYARMVEIRSGAGKLFNKWNDFDNGFAHMHDGAYINKPDEGNISDKNSSYPYFSWDFTSPSETLFSPSRLIPSAGMLGSLPTGVKRGRPWETLLFRPEVRKDASGSTHPGTQPAKDHLVMDLFWMPAIEPYAISEPFSTAGKVNLNYQIAPFTYIRRATALHGALKSEEPLLIPNAASKVYKLWDHETNDHPYYPNNAKCQDAQTKADWDKIYKGTAPFDKIRRPIDPVATLSQADDRFAATGDFSGKIPDIFHSATEICDLHLVRTGETLADYKSGQINNDNLMTGDNTRERPYANLYAKLTTKSNTYTVHFRVQPLKKSRSTGADQWDESKDQVLGEYRGSSLIERFIDPLDPKLQSVDFASTPTASAESYYKFRVLSTKKVGS